jgi:hypothetical protein
MEFVRRSDKIQLVQPAESVERREWPRCPVCNVQITPEFAADFGGCQAHPQRLPDWLPAWRGFTG